MKIKLNNKYVGWGLTAFLVIAASICFYYLIFHISKFIPNLAAIIEILMPVVFGLVMAYLLTPVLNFIDHRLLMPLCNKFGIKDTIKRNKVLRGIGILITSLLFFFLIYALAAMLLSQIVPSIQSIVANFDTYLNNIMAWLDDLLESYPEIKNYVAKNIDKYSNELELWLNNTVLTKTSELIKTISISVLSTLGVLWDFILGFIISIYVLANKETFAGQAKKIIYALFERDSANVVINNFRFTHKTFIGFVGGKILDSAIIGVLCFIGTSLLQLPYAVLVSVIIGVTNVIPFFGPFLGAIPTTILIFVVDPGHPLNCVYFVLFILALQQFDGNILGPKILGNSTGITGFWVIFSITFFGGLFGVPGMVVGVPLFAVIYAMVKAFANEALRKKNMPEETAAYIKVGAVDENGFHEYDPECRRHSNARRKGLTKESETEQKEDAYRACFGDRFYSSAEDTRKDAGTSKPNSVNSGSDCKKNKEQLKNTEQMDNTNNTDKR